MNSQDQANLKFLLSASQEQLFTWYTAASDDDIVYASELLNRYNSLLDDELLGMAIDQAIESMPVLVEAQAVIAAVQ